MKRSMLGRELEIMDQGGETIQVIVPGIEELITVYPAIGWCLDVSSAPWRPIELPPGKMIVETIAAPRDIDKIKSDPRFELFYPPDTIVEDLNLIEVILRIQSGQVKPGDIFICYGTIQVTIFAVNKASVTFELDTGEETRIHEFRIWRVQ